MRWQKTTASSNSSSSSTMSGEGQQRRPKSFDCSQRKWELIFYNFLIKCKSTHLKNSETHKVVLKKCRNWDSHLRKLCHFASSFGPSFSYARSDKYVLCYSSSSSLWNDATQNWDKLSHYLAENEMKIKFRYERKDRRKNRQSRINLGLSEITQFCISAL